MQVRLISHSRAPIGPEREVEFKDGYIESDVMLPINLNFFWPDAEL